MQTYLAITTIDAPMEAVWEVLSDVSAWPELLPTVSKVESFDSKSLDIGARFKVHQPRLRPAIWVVTEVVPPARFVWVAQSPGLKMVADHCVTQASQETTRVSLRFSFSGFLGGFVGRFFGKVTESYLVQEAAALKRKVEGMQ